MKKNTGKKLGIIGGVLAILGSLSLGALCIREIHYIEKRLRSISDQIRHCHQKSLSDFWFFYHKIGDLGKAVENLSES